MRFLKNLIPDWLLKSIRPLYHGTLALFASVYFNRPSEEMVVFGITGTAGKSTTAAMLAHILNFAGKKCGYITTVNFFDGEKDFLNKHGLSMPGGWLLQKQLRQMRSRGCEYAVIECTSEGLAQNRHLGINFDMAMFTNLSRAHLQAHGSFGNYQAAKGKLFAALAKSPHKNFPAGLKKVISVNLDDPMSGYFLSFPAEEKIGVSFKGVLARQVQKVFNAKVIKNGTPAEFEINGTAFFLDLLGDFNIGNAALAAASTEVWGVELATSAQALRAFHGVRGRMENVPNARGFKVIVDYGCEPASFKSALESVAQMPRNRLIHVFGSTGGHRDTEKRFIFGQYSAQFADIIIITNDDVYNSDPEEIANNILQGVGSFKLRKPQAQIILDRRKAIASALSMAKKDDLVLITGKGSEQFLVLPDNKRIAWDDVGVVKEELGR